MNRRGNEVMRYSSSVAEQSYVNLSSLLHDCDLFAGNGAAALTIGKAE
jgi:hypothetical protein